VDFHSSFYVMRLDGLKKSYITIDLNVKLCYTYETGGGYSYGKDTVMEDFWGKLLVVVALGYLAYHVIVDLLLA
jgi:hypothetical protein